MNIAFIHSGFSNSGGIERAVSIIANELSNQPDHNIFSVEYVNNGKQCVELNHKIRRFGLYKSAISMTRAFVKSNLIHKVKKILKENDIDVVIGCGVLYFPITVIAARHNGAKSICWEHTNPKITNDYRFQRIIRKFGLKHSNANVVITESAKIFYDSIKPQKNYLIYNPVDSSLFEKQTSYDIESRKIISVGRLCYAKNYDLLIQVAEKVLSNYKDWSWDIYGDGEEYDRLNQLISKTSVSQRLNLKGNALNIYDLYPEYSFIVMTSRYEGFPMVLLEAAAKSLPLVSFDIETGPKEIIEDGINGFLIEKNNFEMMVEKISNLIVDSKKRKAMSDKSIVTAQKFTAEKACSGWKVLIQNLL